MTGGKLLLETPARQAGLHYRKILHLKATSMFIRGRRKSAGICRSVTIATVLLVLWQWPCHAELQQSYISGTIYNAATGAPIRSATITTTTGLSYTAQNGLFALRVPPNVYDLILSAPGFRSNMATGIFCGPGQTATVNVLLAPASTRIGYLKGRVAASGATSGGIARALVFSDLGAIAVTDDQGYFNAAGPSGAATVTVAAQGYSSKIIKNVQIPPSGMRSLAVSLSSSTKSFTGAVSGAVRDACSGTLLADINIMSSNGAFIQTVDGAFKLSAPLGNTSLLACAEGYQCALQTVTLSFLPMEAQANFPLVPLIRGMGTIEGFITNAATDEPVEGARIATDAQDISFSENEGAYSLTASPCSSTITATRKGFQTYTKKIMLAAGGATALTIALAPLTSCIAGGTVKNLLTGLPVAGALVTADNGNTAVADNAGVYSLAIPSCTAILTICADGFFKSHRRISSAGDVEIKTLDISLIPCPRCRCGTATSASQHDTR